MQFLLSTVRQIEQVADQHRGRTQFLIVGRDALRSRDSLLELFFRHPLSTVAMNDMTNFMSQHGSDLTIARD
nr:hypothetical protein [Rubripirellula reticaptiva]